MVRFLLVHLSVATAALQALRGNPRGCTSLIAIVLIAIAMATTARADDVGMDELVRRMDRLWVERHRPGALQDMVALGMVAQTIDPQSYEAQWRTARAAFWTARTQTNRVLKGAMATRARTVAERAVELNPARAEGHYFLAVSLGEYATTTGIVRAVREGLGGKIESAALRAYELDRDFDDGAPMAVLGRFYFMLPWPKRDLPRSRQFLEELRQRKPNALTGRFYLAETYHALGERDAARRELAYILAHGENHAGDDPEAANLLAAAAMKEWFAQ